MSLLCKEYILGNCDGLLYNNLNKGNSHFTDCCIFSDLEKSDRYAQGHQKKYITYTYKKCLGYKNDGVDLIEGASKFQILVEMAIEKSKESK